jgi:hypothetical protein
VLLTVHHLFGGATVVVIWIKHKGATNSVLIILILPSAHSPKSGKSLFGTVRLVLFTVRHLSVGAIIAVVVIWIQHKGATHSVFIILKLFKKILGRFSKKLESTHEVGAIFHATVYKFAETPLPGTDCTGSVPRTSSANEQSGTAVSRGAALCPDIFFELVTTATLVEKDWLASRRTGQELSSWA